MNNYIQQSPSEKKESLFRQLFKNFPRNLWNAKVLYRVHKSQPRVSVMRQINPVHILSNDLRSILILSPPHPSLGFQPKPCRWYRWYLVPFSSNIFCDGPNKVCVCVCVCVMATGSRTVKYITQWPYLFLVMSGMHSKKILIRSRPSGRDFL